MSAMRSILARCITAFTVSGNFETHDLGGERALARESAFVAGDAVGRGRFAVLDGNLHVIEPGRGQRNQRLCGDAHGGGDEIAVEAGAMGSRRDVGEVPPRARLATGQVHLQNAERRRLLKHARPGRGIELAFSRVERERI